MFIDETTTITTANLIEVGLSLVKVTETEEDDQKNTLAGSLETNSRPHKQGTSDESSNSKRTEEPAKAVFTVSGHKYKVPSGRDGDLELGDSHDDRLHALGCLGERVLERGDGGEDLADANEDVRARDDPDVDGRSERVALGICAFGGQVVVAWAHLVDVVLKDTCIDHRNADDDEASRDALDGAEVDALPAQEGVDAVVEDGDEDDDRDGVQVLDQVVRSAVERHSGGHGAVVAVNLRVAEPEDGRPQEDLTRRGGTGHFADEIIVPREVLWTGFVRVRRW